MINFWRVANGMWALSFMSRDAEEADKKARIHRFRRFIRVERLKMIVGVPLAYAAVWFLLVDPWPGMSMGEIMEHYSSMPPLGLVMGLPLIGIPVMLLLAAGAYTLMGAMFLIGWVQVRFFGFPR